MQSPPQATTDRLTGSSALEDVLKSTTTEQGRTLLALADESPLLLIFLRHFGCAYCRQAIDDVARIKDQLDVRGVRPVFIHLGTAERAKPYFDHYGLSQVERVSDPGAKLYGHAAFQLPRRHPLSHFLEPKVLKGWIMGGIRKYGIGLIQDDGHQMPGVFVIKDHRIANSFEFKTIADQPDYLSLL
jgi:peroxiredoxin